MKIVVCINHVPDTETKVKVGTDGKTIDKAGVNYMLNPYDEFAIEAALQLKEKFGGETLVMSLGGDAHKETLRKALAMGIEKAILLKDDSIRDSYSIAKALAEEIRTLSADCILFGKQSIDYYNEEIPGLVAEFLGLPSVSVVVRININNGKVICEREIEGGHEVVETKIPLVMAAQKGLNEPRYPSLKGIMAAKTKPIEERQAATASSYVEVLTMHKPPPKQPGKIIGTDVNAVPELIRLLREEAKVL
ncbi:MAG: electron transfer flavoprotein subunit beta/FixA family protein [Ignavibacteriae bacterium]|nr:electron transfer flavoprotein subunit beta/FixA family protein [Ignavibacteriota bacterium]